MTERLNNYGDFASGTEEYRPIRKTDVLLTAIQRCQELLDELQESCKIIGELEKEIQFLKDRKDDLEYDNRNLRAELQSFECRG